MSIEFIKVNKNNEEAFKNIYEFYLYDMSKFFSHDVDEKGRFANQNTEKYINNEMTDAILIKNNGKYAGFFLILKKKDINVIEEFGIMPKYRKGFFSYNVTKKLFIAEHKKTKFTILNENKKWLKCMEYFIKKNNDICKLVEKKEITYHQSKEQKYKFTSFLLESV